MKVTIIFSFFFIALSSRTTNFNLLFVLFRYNVLLNCWELESDKRPSFSELVDSLSKLLQAMAGYMDFSSITKSEEVITNKTFNDSNENLLLDETTM